MLYPHQQSRHPPPVTVCAALHCVANWPWRIRFALFGALEYVVLPQQVNSPQPADGLWHTTCFEIFIGLPNTCAYLEINASPSGQWASYQFSDYRVRNVAQDHQLRAYVKQRRGSAGQLVLQVSFAPPARWCGVDTTNASSYAIGLAAVIATPDGALSYWAPHHASEYPDFHHAASRVLRVAAASTPR